MQDFQTAFPSLKSFAVRIKRERTWAKISKLTLNVVLAWTGNKNELFEIDKAYLNQVMGVAISVFIYIENLRVKLINVNVRFQISWWNNKTATGHISELSTNGNAYFATNTLG